MLGHLWGAYDRTKRRRLVPLRRVIAERRRPVLFPHASALLLAAAFLVSPAARAQDATPAATTALPPLLQEMVDAINAGDSAAVAALYAEDGVHEDIPAGVMVRGREEITNFVDGVLGQVSDVEFKPVSGIQTGDLAVLEYDFSVTAVETGQAVSYRGVLIFELDGNSIRRSADYYDLGGLGQPESGEGSLDATPTS